MVRHRPPTAPVPDPLGEFRPATRDWFRSSFAVPTPAQSLGWPAITRGRHALICAPTGSGKTLAAFLWCLDRLMGDPSPADPRRRLRVLYVSPLKALVHDIERNLRAPLAGIAVAAQRRGELAETPRVGLRTGDTPETERRAFGRRPPEILCTTPESLYLLLTSGARESLRGVEWVIVDEIHALAGTKRGAHLALSLERLEALAERAPQRIGLSATQRPLSAVAAFLGGRAPGPAAGPAPGPGTDLAPFPPRLVEIVDAGIRKPLELKVVVPVADMSRLGESVPLDERAAENGVRPGEKISIWPAIHPRILELIRQHRSTIVFVNSRRLAERLAQRLNELAGEELVRAHHGSLAREQRLEIEEALKEGRLPAIVATSSLELGIDMGAVDLVIQVEAPLSVGQGLQRIGRAGHRLDEPSRGVLFPKYRGDLLECALVTRLMHEGAVETTRVPANPLDVLAQQLVAAAVERTWKVDELFALVRRAESFARLGRDVFESVLDMLAGRYPSDEFAELRPRIVWDRQAETVRARSDARTVAVLSGGTIPDRGLFGVYLDEALEGGVEEEAAAGIATGPGPTAPGGVAGGTRARHGRAGARRVGELDEEMVYETRAGEVILLGASAWRVEQITRDRVLVSPAPGEPGKVPFWKGDTLGRPIELGRSLGAFTRELDDALSRGPSRRAGLVRRLQAEHDLDPLAAENLCAYLEEERAVAGALPTDRSIVLQRFRDELGDWRLCLLSPFGGRVHAPWALAIEMRLRERLGLEVQPLWSDDGIVLRLPATELEGGPLGPDPGLAAAEEAILIEPDAVEPLVTEALGGSTLFASRFRENAARALLLPRRRAAERRPLWQMRQRAAQLLAVASRYGSFPIVLETYRECLQDLFDLPALRDLLAGIARREVAVQRVETRGASPFASSLLFDYIATYMYEGDVPAADRRAQALTLDRELLRELLGAEELRELLDRGALAEVELELQALTPERVVRTPDGLHDLLRRLGDLSTHEVGARLVAVVSAVTDDGVAPAVSGTQTTSAAASGTETMSATASAAEAEPEGAADARLERAGRWLQGLRAERRAALVRVAGVERWVAAEDLGRYRDALGVASPPGIAAAFLAAGDDPLSMLLSRWARTHGPFLPDEPASRWGLPPVVVERALERLLAAGTLLRGEFRPGGVEREWCDPDVLRLVRRRSLAHLRREIEPVAPAAYGRFLAGWQGVGSRAGGQTRLLEAIDQLEGAAIPASVLEHDVLAARVAGYTPRLLDELSAAGEILWVGRGALGRDDGRVALYRPERIALLLPDALASSKAAFADAGGAPGVSGSILAEGAGGAPGVSGSIPAEGAGADGWLVEVLRERLRARGAAFHRDLLAAALAAAAARGLPSPAPRDLLDALWSLVWAGEVTSDTFGPLRALRWRRPQNPARPRPGALGVPPEGAGRWSLVEDALATARQLAGGDPPPTARRHALALSLLERHGVVTRDAVVGEGIEGGFGAVYPVLRELEERGRVRRGYFVEGLGGAQFALPGAVDRLRGERRPSGDGRASEAIVIAATDPAQPYGAALPWPRGAEDDRRPLARTAGAFVVLVDGEPVLYLERGGRALEALAVEGKQVVAASSALARFAAQDQGRLRLSIERVNGTPVAGSPLRPALESAGFRRTYRGWTVPRRPGSA